MRTSYRNTTGSANKWIQRKNRVATYRKKWLRDKTTEIYTHVSNRDSNTIKKSVGYVVVEDMREYIQKGVYAHLWIY